MQPQPQRHAARGRLAGWPAGRPVDGINNIKRLVAPGGPLPRGTISEPLTTLRFQATLPAGASTRRESLAMAHLGPLTDWMHTVLKQDGALYLGEPQWDTRPLIRSSGSSLSLSYVAALPTASLHVLRNNGVDGDSMFRDPTGGLYWRVADADTDQPLRPPPLRLKVTGFHPGTSIYAVEAYLLDYFHWPSRPTVVPYRDECVPTHPIVLGAFLVSPQGDSRLPAEVSGPAFSISLPQVDGPHASLLLEVLRSRGPIPSSFAQGVTSAATPAGRPVAATTPAPASAAAARASAPTSAAAAAATAALASVPSGPAAVATVAAPSSTYAAVVAAPPDGAMLLMGATNNFAVNQFLYRAMPFDPVTALAPVSIVADVPSVILTNTRQPATTLAEFVSLARARPGALNFASPGAGSRNIPVRPCR